MPRPALEARLRDARRECMIENRDFDIAEIMAVLNLPTIPEEAAALTFIEMRAAIEEATDLLMAILDRCVPGSELAVRVAEVALVLQVDKMPLGIDRANGYGPHNTKG